MDLEYHAKYNLDRYYRLKAERILRLGGKCTWCGSIQNLEFDHIDPKTKEMEHGTDWAYALTDVEFELEKCQLLCYTCHRKKSAQENLLIMAVV